MEVITDKEPVKVWRIVGEILNRFHLILRKVDKGTTVL